jgi:hypothetical protein
VNNAFFQVEIPIRYIRSFEILSNEYEVQIVESSFDINTGIFTVSMQDDRDVINEVIERARGNI